MNVESNLHHETVPLYRTTAAATIVVVVVVQLKGNQLQ
jgi:hypothetical protein